MNRDDILWKAILEDIFDDFLRFFIPDADDLFDLEKGCEYLDKELAQLFPPQQNEYKPRYVDKLVKVFTKQGAEEWILVHVEVQGYKDDHFAKRMFQYYSRIWDKYDRSIAAFAIFTDADDSYYPDRFEQSFLGTSVHYTFNTCKIMAQSETALEESDNPFAMVALTVKTALKGKQMDEKQLFDLKVDLAKRLLYKQIDKEKIRNLMNFLRYYIRFENHEMMNNFDRAIETITQKNATMGIEQFLLDRAEKQGLEKGIEKGIEQGLEKGMEQGLERGMEQGLERGIEQGIEKVVRNLLQKTDFSVEQIAEIAGVPVAVVVKVKKDVGTN